MKKAPLLKPGAPVSGRKPRQSSSKSSSSPADDSERLNPFALREKLKNRKRMPGANVLLEIQRMQERASNILPMAPFHRLVN